MSETQALKRPFLVGLLAVAIVFVILGGLVAVFGTHVDRPEGVAERWLTAVGDLTRKGVHDDAVKRVAAHGDVALGEQLLTGTKANDKSAFTALEVGKAKLGDGGTAVVPAKLTFRDRSAQPRRLMIQLVRRGDSWRVAQTFTDDATLKVPSDGGDVASKAPTGLYAIALVIGVGIAAGASVLVRAAGREHERLLHA